MTKTYLPPTDSKMWEVKDLNTHEFGQYLRKKSNESNEWTWKSKNDCNLFFSPKGKLIAICFYHGPRKMETKIYVLKEK